MTITVIIQGSNKPRVWHGTCSKCRGQFTWHDDDCLNTYHSQKDGSHSTLNCVTAGCNHTVYGYVKESQ